MEVVLPTGEVLRSGMGALEGSDMWARFKGYVDTGRPETSQATKQKQWLWPKHRWALLPVKPRGRDKDGNASPARTAALH